MGFLERAIRRGVSDAVGNAVGKAVQDAVRPAATNLANKAAGQIEQAAANTAQATAEQTQTAAGTTGNLEGALSNLQRSVENYANEAAKNTKVCPGCKEVTTADKKFCPLCGTKLPEQTLAQGSVCPSCGKQNSIGTKFCQECGTKLPSAVAEEQAAADKNAAVLAQWETALSGFPKWSLRGSDYSLDSGDGYTVFSVTFLTAFAAQNAVNQYREVLRQNGFREAGEYPDREHLYKKVNGVCYHVDTEHCFEGGSETADIYFMHDEPTGGFDYVKPESKQNTGFFGLFK